MKRKEAGCLWYYHCRFYLYLQLSFYFTYLRFFRMGKANWLFMLSIIVIAFLYNSGCSQNDSTPSSSYRHSEKSSPNTSGLAPQTRSFGHPGTSSSNTQSRYRAVVDGQIGMFIQQRNELIRDNGWDRDRANRAVAASWNVLMSGSDIDEGSADQISDYILSRLRQSP